MSFSFDPFSNRAMQVPSRRAFLADVGMGFTGLALGTMLFQDGVLRAESANTWLPPSG
ncbi:MAG: hypothetical protein JWM11_5161, partial [Planctomycetaceae bacterium]|nr:hypothetical protein [Planctomycetaceae bacterium]